MISDNWVATALTGCSDKKHTFAGVTILVDPWLVGDLTFYGQTWAFKGKKGKLPPLNTDEIAAKADLIVITQVYNAIIVSSHLPMKWTCKLPKQVLQNVRFVTLELK